MEKELLDKVEIENNEKGKIKSILLYGFFGLFMISLLLIASIVPGSAMIIMIITFIIIFLICVDFVIKKYQKYKK